MSNRERGNIWPTICVACGALLVLGLPLLIAQRNKSSRMVTVDAQVTIGSVGNQSSSTSNLKAYRWPNSEVPRTAERLRDVSAVAIAAMTYVVDAALHGRPPHDAGEIVSGIAARKLIPEQWLTNQAGVLQMTNGTVHLRYFPSQLSIEVLAVPNERTDGPGILIRIPDAENTSVGPRYFESLQLDGIVYPIPFAPIPEIIAAGWQPRPFKQTQIPDEQRSQLEKWASQAMQK